MQMSTSLCMAAVASALGSTLDRKKSSSGLTVLLPPNVAARPFWLNGTSHRYCAAVPSTYPGPKLVAATGRKAPLVLRAFMNLFAGLRMLRQFCARDSSALAPVVAPCPRAFLESAQSAMMYSINVPTGPLHLPHPW